MNKKRFTYEYNEYNGNLFDNKYNTFYHIEDDEENLELLCYHLNQLSEENEELKEQLKNIIALASQIENYTHDIKIIGDMND